MKIFDKMFLSGYYFTIAIKHREKDDIFENHIFNTEYTLKANLQHWAADPMLIDYEGKTYMFFEAVDGVKGHIEVCEIKEDCSISKPITILSDDCHYSYPFVFLHDGNWYMIPESSEANEVRLYKAVEFPYRWEKIAVLLKGKYVDTTIFEDNYKLYLLTFETDGVTECVKPRAFKFFLNDTNSKLEEIPWTYYDKLQVRGAGQVINLGNELIRPAQISTEHRYGDAVAFYKIDKLDGIYREGLKSILHIDDIKINRRYVDGLHTYSVSEKFETVDIRCRDFDFGKILRKIRKKFK